jgi:ABC-type multidrug transport system ATPase subunit
LRIEQIDDWLAQVRNETGIFAVTRRVPLLRRSPDSHNVILFEWSEVTGFTKCYKECFSSMSEAHPSSDIVVADGLVKQFGRFAALRGVTAQFEAGKLYVVVGDNGAGKTTLLRTIAGLAQQTRGTISVLGSSDIKTVRAQIGYMAHPSLLYDEMSGLENLTYFAGLYGLQPARCREVILAVKLDPDLERPVGQYSQGMRQRMSLARAILNDPKLLLLDEPFSNVDITSAKEMTALLANMRDQGKTLFVVTHQPGLLESIADEFVWMEAGKINRGTPHLQVPQ